MCSHVIVFLFFLSPSQSCCEHWRKGRLLPGSSQSLLFLSCSCTGQENAFVENRIVIYFPPTAIRCSMPVIQNGKVQGDAHSYDEHEFLNFICNPGYLPAHFRLSVCTKMGIRGIWDPTPECERKCGLSDPMDETVSYQCKPGYTRTDGVTWATCTEDGWTPNPLCQGIVKLIL
uniref:Sushi domain-containing protein n=1 Tax=Echeneis naucrates TaxID=173247 RepID=A0A665THV4_ECHNA